MRKRKRPLKEKDLVRKSKMRSTKISSLFPKCIFPGFQRFIFPYAIYVVPSLLGLVVSIASYQIPWFPLIEYSNGCLFNKNGLSINLIQPFFDGGEDVIRQFEVTGVRNANSKLFRSSCFPHTRILKEILEYAKPNMVNIVANADILFDRNSILALQSIENNSIYALARHEADGFFFDRPDSQDAWVFYGNEIKIRMDMSSLVIGKPGFDNRVAYELYKAGYRVSNPSRSIHVWHIHASQQRTYSPEEAIPPPYYAVIPTFLEGSYQSNAFNDNESAPDHQEHGGPFKYIWDHQGNFKIQYLEGHG